MKRRAALSLVPALAGLATLGACRSAGVPAPGSAGTGGEDTGPVTYWSSWKEGEAQQKVLADAITDFTAETRIEVKVEWQGRNVTQKLVPALNTNKVPDLVDGSYGKLAPVLAETGQAAPVDDIYTTEVEGKPVAELIPQRYQQDRMLHEGKPWMIPTQMTGDAFWFDAEAHPELTSGAPKTWAEFLTLMGDLKSSGKVPLAADGDIAGYNAYWFVSLYLRLTGAGKFYDLAADRSGALWDSPEALQAAQEVEKIVKGGYLVNGYGASKWPAQQQAWATGKAELLFNGSWIPTETAPYATKGFQFGSFPFPAVTDGGPRLARADFTGFAIPAKAQHKSAAGAFATFLLRKKYQDRWGTEAKVLPVREDAATAPVLQPVLDDLRQADAVYQQSDGVAFPGYIEKVFWPVDDELFLGKLTANEFVAKMKTTQIDYWKNQS